MLQMRSRAIALLVILWVLPVGLLTGGTWSSQVDRTLSDSRFNAEESQQIRQIFTRADEELLPVDPLVLRLNEGIAKGIGPTLLRDALDAHADAYRKTREIVRLELGDEEADRLFATATVWDRTVTLYREGVEEQQLGALLDMFSKQRSADKWNNYRYGGGLLMALQQWGMESTTALSIIESLSRSAIAGEEYRGILDLLNTGIAQRIPPQEMAQRIIRSAPKSRTMHALGRMVR